MFSPSQGAHHHLTVYAYHRNIIVPRLLRLENAALSWTSLVIHLSAFVGKIFYMWLGSKMFDLKNVCMYNSLSWFNLICCVLVLKACWFIVSHFSNFVVVFFRYCYGIQYFRIYCCNNLQKFIVQLRFTNYLLVL